MITTTVHDDIRAFAAAVRSHLDDLPVDEVDDLLDGLEADLADQASEAGEEFTIPDAATYAAELRAAAGLPERGSAVSKKRVPLVQQVKTGSRELHDLVRANPAGAWLLDLFVALRPVWWVLRAVVLYLLIAPVLIFNGNTSDGFLSRALTAANFPGLVVFLGILLLSIQWGRGRWIPGRPLRILRTIVNVLAVAIAPFFLVGLLTSLQTAVWNATSPPFQASAPGLALDGNRIRNIFAYDSDGNPISSVQLFDQEGRPLTTVGMAGSEDWDIFFAGGGGPVPVADTSPGRAPLWNVYPLREVPADKWTWTEIDLSKAVIPAAPFAHVQPLPGTGVGPTTGATPSPQPTEAVAP